MLCIKKSHLSVVYNFFLQLGLNANKCPGVPISVLGSPAKTHERVTNKNNIGVRFFGKMASIFRVSIIVDNPV